MRRILKPKRRVASFTKLLLVLARRPLELLVVVVLKLTKIPQRPNGNNLIAKLTVPKSGVMKADD